jgi:hypothetical protein
MLAEIAYKGAVRRRGSCVGAAGTELQELNEAEFDLSVTGFDPKEIDDLLLDPEDDDKANAAPPLPDNPVSRLGDPWICSRHREFCAGATSPESVARLLGDRKPFLLVTDPPYGIELDSEWRDRAGLNGCGPAAASCMKQRTAGHTETTISRDTRADWSEAYEPVSSLQIVRMARLNFYSRGAQRHAAHRLPVSAADYLELGGEREGSAAGARELWASQDPRFAVESVGRVVIPAVEEQILEIEAGRRACGPIVYPDNAAEAGFPAGLLNVVSVQSGRFASGKGCFRKESLRASHLTSSTCRRYNEVVGRIKFGASGPAIRRSLSPGMTRAGSQPGAARAAPGLLFSAADLR